MIDPSVECKDEEDGNKKVVKINEQYEKNIPANAASSLDDQDHYPTLIKDSSPAEPSQKPQPVGRRRDLVTAMIRERVFQKLTTREEIVDTEIKPSEYNDQYGDPNFVPFLDKLQVNETVRKYFNLAKYPLYTSNNYTIYKAIVDRGGLKAREEIWDLNEPFRKSCTFTTPPEFALREPRGGF